VPELMIFHASLEKPSRLSVANQKVASITNHLPLLSNLPVLNPKDGRDGPAPGAGLGERELVRNGTLKVISRRQQLLTFLRNRERRSPLHSLN
jgi:hypothetical protein